jgi:ankyrin repeat protein
LDKRTLKEVKSTLARLSKGAAALDGAYSDALQRIEGQLDGDRRQAKEVLSWITYAKRPLTTAEICCALAVESDEAEIDPENIPDVDDIVSVCAGLVVVDQESAVIRLVHYTTQEYFERIRGAWNSGGEQRIAATCLRYLSFSVFESGSCSTDKKLEERLSQNEFLEYAAKFGGEHARPVETEVASLACSVLLHSGLLSSATQILFVPSFKYMGYSKSDPAITGLHWAARFGLCHVADEFLRATKEDRMSAVNARDGLSRSPLIYASEYGHYGMAEWLLDKGGDVDAQDRYYGNALHAASASGNEVVVRLLLDKGVAVNAQGGVDGNALQLASLEGHEAVVRLLLNKGANINAQGGEDGNALQAASSNGNEVVVRLLLDKGADVDAQGGYYGNALQAASAGGSEAVVRLLLNKGANINAQGGEYGNALQAASSGGHEAVVKLLLDKGAVT